MEGSALVYILLTVITVGLGLCVQNRETVAAALRGGYAPGEYRPMSREKAGNLVAEIAVYCLLTGVSACRIAVGNDYWVYRDNFKLIAQERHVSSEIGFNVVVYWLQKLFGYDHYLPIFAFFSIITVYFFVRALHDQGEDYGFALFLFMTSGYYFYSLNTVRYYLVLAIALYSMKYVLRREYGKFILWVLVGALFHKTILLVIPVYLMAHHISSMKLKKWHFAAAGLFVGSLVLCRDFYRYLFFQVYPYYENSAFDNGRISYTNIAKCLGVLGLCLAVYFLDNRSVFTRIPLRFYFTLNLMGLAAFACGSFIPESTRIGYYMSISQIFLIPGVISGIEKKWLKELCRWGVILCFCVYFALLLKQMYLIDNRLLPYLNWIFN